MGNLAYRERNRDQLIKEDCEIQLLCCNDHQRKTLQNPNLYP